MPKPRTRSVNTEIVRLPNEANSEGPSIGSMQSVTKQYTNGSSTRADGLTVGAGI